MSPLAMLILRAIRLGAIGSAVAVAAVLGLRFWLSWQQGMAMSGKDLSFIGLLAAVLLGAVLLARAVARELRR